MTALGHCLISNTHRAVAVNRSGLLAFILFFLILPSGLCHSATPLAELQTEIAESIAQISEQGSEFAAAVALVGPDGFVWTQGFGYIDEEHEQPVDADTLFSIMSGSKVFTAIAVMRAVEDGKLDLDKPISTWLPDFTARSRFSGRPENQITLRLLLSHRAGLADETSVFNNFTTARPSFNRLLAAVHKTWLRYPVGERHLYTNLSIDVAGWVLQEQAERPFDEVVREQVLLPLGMHRSTYATPDLRNEKNRAIGRVADQELPPELSMLPSGGLYSSANDLAHFLRFQIDRGKPLLQRDTWDTIHRIVDPVSPYQSRGYGLGVILDNVDNRILIAEHNGGGFGFNSELMWIPDLGIGLAALQTGLSSEIVNEVRRLFMDKARSLAGRDEFVSKPDLRAPIKCSEDDALALPLGTWVDSRGQINTIIENGKYGVYRTVFREICISEEGLLVTPSRGLRSSYRIDYGKDGRPIRFVGLYSGNVYDYNDGPNDPPGPNSSYWHSLLGTYEMLRYGIIPNRLILRQRNGYLYLNDVRLTEIWPLIFIASNGAVLDLRGKTPTWRNIYIQKIAEPPTEEESKAAVKQALSHYALLREGKPEEFLNHCSTELKAVFEPWLDDLRKHKNAPVPAGYEVDYLGSIANFGNTTRVLLIPPNVEGTYRVDMYFNENGKIVDLHILNSAPRTWWQTPGALQNLE